jgi:hypothetical protein
MARLQGREYKEKTESNTGAMKYRAYTRHTGSAGKNSTHSYQDLESSQRDKMNGNVQEQTAVCC